MEQLHSESPSTPSVTRLIADIHKSTTLYQRTRYMSEYDGLDLDFVTDPCEIRVLIIQEPTLPATMHQLCQYSIQSQAKQSDIEAVIQGEL